MNRILKLIWYWCLVILPFTAILTFILTLVVCSQAQRKIGSYHTTLPNISILAKGPGYRYFVAGFVLLVPQLLLITLGRLLFLLHSQTIVHHVILYIIHSCALVISVFLLIMAIVSVDHNGPLHVTGAIGMFSSFFTYFISHTIVVFYLFIRRAKAPRHSNILLPLWFLMCCVLAIVCFSIWAATSQSIPQYIAAGTPFLYILGFIPQFWSQARMKRRSSVASFEEHNIDRINL
ncbi:unnamed protein product [Adineta ricciae]|uniref:CWH43-like N-terminal domain-containing protein n=1 Tax=Adineta ricciae TaxID=249248 RepID=A0A816DZ37_ADIRI|nr:unnamed protein product [Adineta ricciae]CAF1642190.1 unnamed protein product [Adineta ricciae]